MIREVPEQGSNTQYLKYGSSTLPKDVLHFLAIKPKSNINQSSNIPLILEIFKGQYFYRKLCKWGLFPFKRPVVDTVCVCKVFTVA